MMRSPSPLFLTLRKRCLNRFNKSTFSFPLACSDSLSNHLNLNSNLNHNFKLVLNSRSFSNSDSSDGPDSSSSSDSSDSDRGSRRDVDSTNFTGPSDAQFHQAGDEALEDCLDLVESVSLDCAEISDFSLADGGCAEISDFSLADGGVLSIEIVSPNSEEKKNTKSNTNTIVINKHQATKQIWYSSPCGARYFDYPYEKLVSALEADLKELGLDV